MSLVVKEYRSCAIRKVSISPSRQAIMQVFVKADGRKAAIAPSPTESPRRSSNRDGGENPEQQEQHQDREQRPEQQRVARSQSPGYRPWHGDNTPVISLSNFESINHGLDAINSPRSVALCQEYGIRVSELVPRTLNQFRAAGVPLNIAQLRFDHYETRRAEKVSLLTEEREHRIHTTAEANVIKLQEEEAAAFRNNQSPASANTPPRGEDESPKGRGRSHRTEAGAVDEEGSAVQQRSARKNSEDTPVLGLLSEHTKDLIQRAGDRGASPSHKSSSKGEAHHQEQSVAAGGGSGLRQGVMNAKDGLMAMTRQEAPHQQAAGTPRPASGNRNGTPVRNGSQTPRSSTPIYNNVPLHQKVPTAFRRLTSATVPDDVRNARAELLVERENRRRLVYERAQKVKEERQCDSLLKQLDSQRRSAHQRSSYEEERRTRLEAQRLYREDLTGAIQQKKRQEEYVAKQDIKKMAQIRCSSVQPTDKYQVQLAKSMYMTPRQRAERRRSASVQPVGSDVNATMNSYNRGDGSSRGPGQRFAPATPR